MGWGLAVTDESSDRWQVPIRKAIVRSQAVFRLRVSGHSRIGGSHIEDMDFVGYYTQRVLKTPVFPKVLPGDSDGSFDNAVRAYEDG